MHNLEDLQKKAARATALLKNMSNPVRLKVLCALTDGERSVTDLVELTHAAQSSLSQHLGKLREHRLVKTRRDGHLILYSLSGPEAEHMVNTLYRIYCGGEAAEAPKLEKVG